MSPTDSAIPSQAVTFDLTDEKERFIVGVIQRFFGEHRRLYRVLAVALGADPATMLAAVTPVPDSLSEYQFAGLLRGGKTEVVKCLGSDLQVPASAVVPSESAEKASAGTIE